MFGSTAERHSLHPEASHDIREDDSHLTSHLPGPTVVSRTEASEESGPPKVSVMVTLTEEALLELEWWSSRINLMNGKFSYQGPGSDPGDRCILAGLGSSLQGCTNWESMVTEGMGQPHQLSSCWQPPLL